MYKFLVGLFLVLHGLVHLLYFGQSMRFFELQPGLVWPDGAWAFSKLLGDAMTRRLAGIACVLAATGFVAGGIGVWFGQGWQRPLVISSAVFSSLLVVLFWNGKMQQLPDQGFVGLLINLVILLAWLVFRVSF